MRHGDIFFFVFVPALDQATVPQSCNQDLTLRYILTSLIQKELKVDIKIQSGFLFLSCFVVLHLAKCPVVL